MKVKILLTACCNVVCNVILGQNYQSPETIRWDPIHEKLLVSNEGGTILSVDLRKCIPEWNYLRFPRDVVCY